MKKEVRRKFRNGFLSYGVIGSTRDFDSLGLGSNPSRTTKGYRIWCINRNHVGNERKIYEVM